MLLRAILSHTIWSSQRWRWRSAKKKKRRLTFMLVASSRSCCIRRGLILTNPSIVTSTRWKVSLLGSSSINSRIARSGVEITSGQSHWPHRIMRSAPGCMLSDSSVTDAEIESLSVCRSILGRKRIRLWNLILSPVGSKPRKPSSVGSGFRIDGFSQYESHLYMQDSRKAHLRTTKKDIPAPFLRPLSCKVHSQAISNIL